VYELRLARSARKELEALPDTTLNRVARQLDFWATDPRPRGRKKLRGARDLWRIRIGDYHVAIVWTMERTSSRSERFAIARKLMGRTVDGT
jgi:mRNA-degrading endonuclease RelE of RelBE toxin-antitoxin system